MGFCGNCGKKSSPEDKFCTECGAGIKESKISVLEETGQVIKEEYKQSTAPPQVKTSQGEHIGDQRRKGEWLESTTQHILKFAGFETEREIPFVFNDSTGDKFRIDVLARDRDIEIFVECKDLADLKMSEKIMYTLTGQLDDYRKHQPKTVIGILAMTAKDDGRNQGIRENLRKHNCFLWDGSFLEHLNNKMTEFGNKEDFRRYVLDHIDVFEDLEKKPEGQYYDFMVKYSFFTISPSEYVGKSFDVMNIIDDIKDELSGNVSIINFRKDMLKEGKEVISYNVTIDFSLKLTREQIEKFAKERKKFGDKIRRRKSEHIIYREFKKDIFGVLSKTYGVSYNPKKKSEYYDITFEGSRIK